MIELTPEAVKIVLDKCVKSSDHPKMHEDFTIEFNYKYIDPGPQGPICRHGPYNAMLAMLKWDREELLAHPLCQSNLSYKWRGFGRVIQLSSLLTQFGFMIVLFLFYFLNVKPHEDNYQCYPPGTTSVNGSNKTVFLSNFFNPSRRPKFGEDYLNTLENMLYIFMILVSAWELGNIISLGRRHLFSAQFSLTLLTVLLICYATLPPGHAPCDQEWRAIAYGTQVYFITASLFIVRYDKIGLYFVMYFEVIKTMLKVSVMLFFFVAAMSIPFDVFMHEDGFRSYQPAILSTLAMTVGEIQFRDNFIKGTNHPFRYELYCLFAVTCIFLNLALMNLMIGAAVGDISKVEKRAYLTRLRTQVTFLLDSETAVLGCLKNWFHTQKLVLRPNRKPKTFWQAIFKKLIYPEQIEFIKKTEEMNQTAQNAQALKEEMLNQRKQINELVKTTNTILETLQKLGNNQTVVRPYTPDTSSFLEVSQLPNATH
ncbi:transient receptor potential cation channel subfamily a member 1 [Plakobranchus ocellatus]|uniref:Transient receptor potential cation channel subfamily a member 1 n=1 Tax=Plakobranchus ocellatus TaxID=259542 RepID=A0AAV4BWX2_9GAST|nr:transient receptor potential cation channel subfamily a member 1 [Plakobranchus ocellatus]